MDAPTPPLEESLKKNKKLKRADIKHLQQWLKKHPHFPAMTDEELVPFVCSAAFSLERAKARLDRYLHIRSDATDLFTGRDPTLADNQAQMDIFHIWASGGRDARGRRVVGMGYAPGADLSRFDATRSAMVSLALMELVVLEEPAAEECAVVLDARNLSMGHLARASLSTLHQLLTYVQEAAPFHIDAVHVIHVNPLVEKAHLLTRPFLGKEMLRLLHFHSGTMEAFYDDIPKEMLPEEYGGTNGSVHDYYDELRRRALKYGAWTVSLERRCIDESKRPADAPRSASRALFGSDGSFRRLDID